MKVMMVDDEARALNLMRFMLSDMDDVELAAEFQNCNEALEYLRSPDTVKIDILFLDIEMPGIDGVSMAEELKKLSKPPRIVFVTGYEKHAYAAWKAEAVDFLLKPYEKEDIRHAIDRCKSFRRTGDISKIEIKCFPSFDLFVNDVPVKFRNKKAKELLAYLVHCQGKWVITGDIVYDVFGGQDEEQAKKYYNVVAYRLRRTLAEEGIGSILQIDYGKCRIDTDNIVCDYYRYLRGESELFTGSYMQQYSWAEPAAATMLERKQKLDKSKESTFL